MTDLSPIESRRLESAIKELTQEMRALPDRMAETYVRQDNHARDLALIEERQEAAKAAIGVVAEQVDDHSKYFDWIVKIVLGAVIVALLGLVVAQGGAFH